MKMDGWWLSDANEAIIACLKANRDAMARYPLFRLVGKKTLLIEEFNKKYGEK